MAYKKAVSKQVDASLAEYEALQKCQQCGALVRDHVNGHCARWVDPVVSDTRCPGCGVPGGRCAYCNYMQNIEDPRRYELPTAADIAARARMALMDKRERPRETATSRMMALPHPWETEE